MDGTLKRWCWVALVAVILMGEGDESFTAAEQQMIAGLPVGSSFSITRPSACNVCHWDYIKTSETKVRSLMTGGCTLLACRGPEFEFEKREADPR